MSSFDFMRPLDSLIDHRPSQDTQVGPTPVEDKSFKNNRSKATPEEKLVNISSSRNSRRVALTEWLIKRIRPHRAVATPAPSRFSPWLIKLAYPIGRRIIVPFYFGRVEVTGRENLPLSGPVILAPTHRSRWDAFMVPYAAGYDITGRHLRFMVSADEVVGFQGWFIRRMGGFPIDTTRPAIASLRHGVDLLHYGETLVIFPEGNIFRGDEINRLKPGLARLALQAEASHGNLGVHIVPISLHYSHSFVPWRCRVNIRIGKPLKVADYAISSPKKEAQRLTGDLYESLQNLGSIR